MKKITVGSDYGHSTTKFSASLSESSNIEITIGDSYDFSKREIEIIERDAPVLLGSVSQLRSLILDLEKSEPGDNNKAALGREAKILADHAERIVQERKWYSVSAKGLLEAAIAVGAAASPIVDLSLKIINLLKQVKT